MSLGAVTCCEADSLNDAARKMWEHDIGALPVTDAQERPIGMITDRDITMAAYTQGKPLSEMTVDTAMSSRLFSVKRNTPLQQAARVMQEHQIRRVPVTDGDGRAVGVLSLNDLARAVQNGHSGKVSAKELATTLRAVCQSREPDPGIIAAE